ncbi:helix-turn-helix transcriptional regulator [Alienimonas sp. DA493]|uniref:helix-turn-helix transcriptional regulator n=1 Tax=Alienimonas sp. DA493 TaxID=3373605 RepID=UPI0037543302
MTNETPSIVNVTEMARMVGLSRQRFWQLAAEGVFLMPIYDVRSRRPFYDDEMQETNLRVRKTNYGLNGRPVLFYARRTPTKPKPEPSRRRSVSPKAPAPKYESLVEGLKGLGMASATAAQVEAALETLYPSGPPADEGETLRAAFVHLMRRPDRAEKVER